MPTTVGSAYVAGPLGPWRIEKILAVRGPTLPTATNLRYVERATDVESDGAAWVLTGAPKPDLYTLHDERQRLDARSARLGRPGATHAALIPIKKSSRWWSLSAGRRREIFEERSHHIAVGLEDADVIARRLLHCPAGSEFDFLTWFEFEPGVVGRFEALLEILRESAEWTFVEREVDMRLTRVA